MMPVLYTSSWYAQLHPRFTPVRLDSAHMQAFELVVPNGVVAGQTIQAVTPNGPVQVAVPAGLAAGDRFQVQLPPSDEAAKAAASALSQLGNLGRSVTFGLSSSSISGADGLIDQSVAGEMPVTSGEPGVAAGPDVMKLRFQSSKRGRHLHAELATPDGTRIAVLDMGEVPKSTPGALFGSAIGGYSTAFQPPPPVQLSVLGQAYGTYTCTSLMNCGVQAGARWQRRDGTGGAMIAEPERVGCCTTAPQSISRKKSALGKKEVPFTATFDVEKGHPAETTMVHAVTDSSAGKVPQFIATNVRQVVVELDKITDPHKKLDCILIGATLAALNVTTGIPSSGGGG